MVRQLGHLDARHELVQIFFGLRNAFLVLVHVQEVHEHLGARHALQHHARGLLDDLLVARDAEVQQGVHGPEAGRPAVETLEAVALAARVGHAVHHAAAQRGHAGLALPARLRGLLADLDVQHPELLEPAAEVLHHQQVLGLLPLLRGRLLLGGQDAEVVHEEGHQGPEAALAGRLAQRERLLVEDHLVGRVAEVLADVVRGGLSLRRVLPDEVEEWRCAA
mmetsp:Transcript_110953/g.310372  ORF Transcript_110953/g.310372 Transcript_110953/m.310372 type:complete len:221 (-) Transcript_110953:646-1308(-)